MDFPACVASWTESEKKGLKCNLGKLRTETQFIKNGLFFKRNERIGLFSKELGQTCKKTKYLDQIVIFKSIWTKM